MEPVESRIDRLEFYVLLLLENANITAKPFYALIIKSQLTKVEMEEILLLCEDLNKKYNEQKAEGLVDYTPLLTQFVGMLNPKIPPDEVITALSRQGLYRELMKEFLNIIEQIGN